MAESKNITIVTHNGHFHADEILAVSILVLVLEKNAYISIIRSREKEVIENGDYVVDVGGIYDESKNRFDHHQAGGAGVRENGIPYASSGLVWKKYGEILSKNKEIVEKIDKKLIQPTDAIDVGIQFMETKINDVFLYEIGEFFEAFYPSWREGENNVDSIFLELVSIAKKLMQREIIRNQDKLEANFFVEKVYSESLNKELIIFDEYYPARELLSKFPEPLFVIYPRGNGDWMLATIRVDDRSFANRKDLPKIWAGKRDEELEKITGISEAIFCHPSLFLAGAKTKEAIIKMAELALNS